jgi:hypothetical protein
MLEYRKKVVNEPAACTFDRCGRRMTADLDQDWEWNEKRSISFEGGFGSVFGDGNRVHVDLCQQRVLDTLGQWLRITDSDAASTAGES